MAETLHPITPAQHAELVRMQRETQDQINTIQRDYQSRLSAVCQVLLAGQPGGWRVTDLNEDPPALKVSYPEEAAGPALVKDGTEG